MELFPTIEPYETGWLRVDPLHTLYWEQCGKPDGVPMLFLHGGPGAGASAGHRRFFDPRHYRVVLLDQRGAGRSKPYAETRKNETGLLIDDLEALRRHLDIDSWVVFGGSWGSSLGLAYAEAFPERCRALILRGIFLCTDAEIDWFMTGMRRFFPEAWRAFADFLPEEERDDLLGGYYRRLLDEDPAVHQPAAEAWSRYEATCSTLLPNAETVDALSSPDSALALARLEAHYFAHHCFLETGQLLRSAGRLAGIPGVIVQGRYDVVCPPSSAYALAEAWPDAELSIVPDAGHSATEPGIARTLVAAAERCKRYG